MNMIWNKANYWYWESKCSLRVCLNVLNEVEDIIILGTVSQFDTPIYNENLRFNCSIFCYITTLSVSICMQMIDAANVQKDVCHCQDE